jgi:hypothetical protein
MKHFEFLNRDPWDTRLRLLAVVILIVLVSAGLVCAGVKPDATFWIGVGIGAQP